MKANAVRKKIWKVHSLGCPTRYSLFLKKTTLETIFAKATILSNESKDKQLDTFKVWKFGNSQPGSVNVGSGLSLTSGLKMGQDTFWDTPMTLDHWSIVIPKYTDYGIGCPQKTNHTLGIFYLHGDDSGGSQFSKETSYANMFKDSFQGSYRSLYRGGMDIPIWWTPKVAITLLPKLPIDFFSKKDRSNGETHTTVLANGWSAINSMMGNNRCKLFDGKKWETCVRVVGLIFV